MKNLNNAGSNLILRFRYSVLLELGIAMIAIALVAWVLSSQVEKTVKAEVEDSLNIVLKGTHQAISVWASHHLHSAERIAQLPDMRGDAESILSIERDQNSLLSSPWQQHLRDDLQILIQANQYHDYFLVGPDNINLVSSSEFSVGKPNLLQQQVDVLDKIWSGEAAMSRPMRSDVPLPMDDGMLMDNHPTMFVGAPIKNQSGHVIALLLLRLDPFDGFFPLTQLGRLGQSGETYAFDASGLLLSESRFDEQLIKLGFIKQGEHSSLAFKIQDPGINLLDRKQQSHARSDLPFTRMAASATQGNSGNDLEGYRDYRGVAVVGAWLWDEKLMMGLTVEQDIREAYSTLGMMKRIIYSSAIFSMFILIGMLGVSQRGKRNLLRTEARLDAVFNNAVDGIAVIDEKGVIENVNPAILTIFGYTRKELIGQNINILMPEPYKCQHDNYLRNYRDTGERKIIGIGREVKGQHKAGGLISIDLSISELLIEGERCFAGIIHDISDRVAIEEKLHQANDELRLMAMVAQKTDNAVIVADHEGQVVWVNDGFTAMCGYNLEEIVGRRPGDVLQGIDTDPATVERIRVGLRQGQKVEEEILNYKISGEAYWVHLEITPIFDEQGELIEFISLEHDITERKTMMAELQLAKMCAESASANLAKNEQVLLLSLAAAGAGYWNIDFSSGLLKMDKRSVEIFGIPGILDDQFTCRYQDWANWVHPDNFPAAQAAFINALDDPEVTNFNLEYRILWPSNEVRYVNVSFNIERDKTGAPVSAYGLYFDETERKQTEDILEQSMDEAEAANRAKSSFLAAMSHEIRTPMNGVVGMIDVLSHTTLNREQKDVVHTIRESSFSLLTIIDDILDFSKIEAGKLSLESLPTSIEEVLEGVGDTLLPIAKKKGVELLIFCSPNIPPSIYTDPVRLRQILFNLGGNAIKFVNSDSEKTGRVFIRAEAETMVDDRMCLHVTVEDNGIGMSQEVQARLFQPFSQGENSTTRRYGGTGLGLTICRRLVDLMGGRIDMESDEGEGSVFSVHIPLEIASTEAPQEVISLEGVNVLQVNSEETLDLILDTYLTVAGANVVRMNTGDNAARVIQDLSPNPGELVVILDGHTSSGQSQTLHKQLSQELAIYKPVFVVLGHGSRQNPRKDSGYGVSMDVDSMHRLTFLRAVAASMGRISLEPSSATVEHIKHTVPVSVADAKAANKLILIAEDYKTNQTVLLHQLGILGYAAEVANDGREALSMWRNGDYALLLTDCHMPEMDGYELARSIRLEEDDAHHIPIVAITADTLKDTRKLCLTNGMDDYLSKPVQIKLLGEKLTQWLGDNTPSGATDTATVEVSAGAAEVVDSTALMKVLGTNDEGILVDFYTDFVRTAEETIDAISTAHINRDATEIGSLAHRLKSSARTIGANVMADCCMALELAGKDEDWKNIDTQIDQLPVYFHAAKDWVHQQYS